MFKRVICTSILVGAVVLAGKGYKESLERTGYTFGEPKKETEQNIQETNYVEPSEDTLKALDEGLKANKEVRDSEPSLDEKLTEKVKDYIEAPVGTESPFYVDGSETGENPVYSGMTKEATQKPHRDDKYANSPFYNPETGENVVETGEEIQDNMSDETSPYIK